jgi:uncharacterized RDD family membrane protein YckC
MAKLPAPVVKPDNISKLPSFPPDHHERAFAMPMSRLGILLLLIFIVIPLAGLTYFNGLYYLLIYLGGLIAFFPLAAYPFVMLLLTILIVYEQRPRPE